MNTHNLTLRSYMIINIRAVTINLYVHISSCYTLQITTTPLCYRILITHIVRSQTAYRCIFKTFLDKTTQSINKIETHRFYIGTIHKNAYKVMYDLSKRGHTDSVTSSPQFIHKESISAINIGLSSISLKDMNIHL